MSILHLSKHIIHIDFYCEADVALLTLRPSSFSLTLSPESPRVFRLPAARGWGGCARP